LTVDSSTQAAICPLTTSNLPVVNKQNDIIKDKGIDKEKDNLLGDVLPSGKNPPNKPEPEAELEEISPERLLAMGARFEITKNDLIRIIDTGKLFKIKGS
jgi:hypothetical protein